MAYVPYHSEGLELAQEACEGRLNRRIGALGNSRSLVVGQASAGTCSLSEQECQHGCYNDALKKVAVKLTPAQAAEVAV